MAVQRKRVCTHCSKEFTTSQYAAKYCSSKCKTATRSNKTATNRISKIPCSDEWLWISRECKRAGTIEILQDVDLEQLFSVYRRRFKCYGWDSEKKVSKFHLCHISPVKGQHTTGLLHHQNLFIGGSLPNQVQGTNSYAEAGLSIANNNLKPRWYVNEDDSDKAVLAKVQKYLGSKLIEYAKKNPIRKAQRFVIAERVSKHKDNTLPLADLQRMGTQALLKLEASLNDTDAYNMKLTAKRSLVVYSEELERFASYSEGQRKSDYEFVSAAIRIVAQWLSNQHSEYGLDDIVANSFRWYYEFNPLSLRPNKDSGKLRDYITFTAFSTLQGAVVDRQLVTNTLRSYLQIDTLMVKENGVFSTDDSITDFDYIQEEHDLFKENVVKVKAAFDLVGLLDTATLHRLRENDKSFSFAQSYRRELACAEYYDYPDDYYRVEVDFIPFGISDPFIASLPF